MTNTSGRATPFSLFIEPGIGAVSYVRGIGAHTAELGPGGAFCGEFEFDRADFTATSSVPVRGHVRALDEDTLEEVADLYTVTAPTAAQTVAAPGRAIDACVTNTSSGTAEPSFELT